MGVAAALLPPGQIENPSTSMAHQAIFFDLFNTLLHLDYALLPEVEFEGKRFPTTTLEIYHRLQQEFDVSFPYPHFLGAYLEIRNRIDGMIREELREFSCDCRFYLLQKSLGIPEAAVPVMVNAHMGEMFRMMYLPAQNEAVLNRLDRYPLVLASNSDHARTARRALQKFQLAPRFAAIFISEEVGWRKPSRRFFESVIRGSGFDPEKCLYVGDDPCADVYGGIQAGFQVVWLAGSDPERIPRVAPNWRINKLSELLELLPESG